MEAKPGDLQEPRNVMDIIRRRDVLFGRLEALATRQRELVAEQDMELLLGVLMDRQRLSSELTDLSRELAPVQRDWSVFRAKLEPGDRDEADRLMELATSRIRRLMDRDEEDARRLEVRKRGVSRTLHEAGSAQQALNAYQSYGSKAARIDCLDDGTR